MRTFTKILVVAALAMAVGSTASANVVITLTQTGGTYDGVAANPGDTLVLDIGYNITGADAIIGISPAIAYPTAVASFTAATELNGAFWSPGFNLGPLNAGIAHLTSGANSYDTGWEIAGLGTGANSPCVFAPAGGSCTSLGTVTLTLTGLGGVIDTGLVLAPAPGGTQVLTAGSIDVTNLASLGTFTVLGAAIPEPTTASLLGFGLVGLTMAGRRRKN